MCAGELVQNLLEFPFLTGLLIVLSVHHIQVIVHLCLDALNCNALMPISPPWEAWMMVMFSLSNYAHVQFLAHALDGILVGESCIG